MSVRFDAISHIHSNGETSVEGSNKITTIFGENVFTSKVARKFLSEEAYKSLQSSIKAGQKIDRAM